MCPKIDVMERVKKFHFWIASKQGPSSKDKWMVGRRKDDHDDEVGRPGPQTRRPTPRLSGALLNYTLSRLAGLPGHADVACTLQAACNSAALHCTALLTEAALLSPALPCSSTRARPVTTTRALFRYQIYLPNSTMQKKDSHHIKMSAHAWSTKWRWNQKLIAQFCCTLRDERFKPN
jgi:hypothetical protein